MVLDNLKEGVLKPDLYEPALNPVYAAMLAHYEVVADPARVRDPNLGLPRNKGAKVTSCLSGLTAPDAIDSMRQITVARFGSSSYTQFS